MTLSTQQGTIPSVWGSKGKGARFALLCTTASSKVRYVGPSAEHMRDPLSS